MVLRGRRLVPWKHFRRRGGFRVPSDSFQLERGRDGAALHGVLLRQRQLRRCDRPKKFPLACFVHFRGTTIRPAHSIVCTYTVPFHWLTWVVGFRAHLVLQQLDRGPAGQHEAS